MGQGVEDRSGSCLGHHVVSRELNGTPVIRSEPGEVPGVTAKIIKPRSQDESVSRSHAFQIEENAHTWSGRKVRSSY